MSLFLSLMLALFVTMALIPALVRISPWLGTIDTPDPRKVHAVPISRAGGIGIVIGTLTPVMVFLGVDTLVQSYVLGGLLLMVFGAWDDSRELGHYPKFAGQFLAVGAVVFYGDLWVSQLPFGLPDLPPWLGQPFTMIAMVGVVNALNHSDGLDGLAAGETLLSLAVMGYLSYLANGFDALLIAIATTGGLLGFLRFNSHPARVFMDDSGSQFLGFTVAFIGVLLTQQLNPALSMALPLLLFGVPVIDILAVFWLRKRHGLNLFRATRNHLHHRLLDLGFTHFEVVVVLYTAHTLFVVSALILRYESDWLVLLAHLWFTGLLFAGITLAERHGWRAGELRDTSPVFAGIVKLEKARWVRQAPPRVLYVGFAVFLVTMVATAPALSSDLGVAALVAAVAGLVMFAFGSSEMVSMMLRLLAYFSGTYAAYLSVYAPPAWLVAHPTPDMLFFGIMFAAVAASLRFAQNDHISVTPFDYLMLFVFLAMAVASAQIDQFSGLSLLLGKCIVLLYAAELIASYERRRWSPLGLVCIYALGTAAARAFGSL